MTTLAQLRTTWDRRFAEMARERGLRTVGGYAYTDDGGTLTASAVMIGAKSDPLRVSWWVETKPVALDDALWAAFLPDLDAGPAKRRTMRVNGAFAAPTLELARGVREVDLSAVPDETVAWVLDEMGAQRESLRRRGRGVPRAGAGGDQRRPACAGAPAAGARPARRRPGAGGA